MKDEGVELATLKVQPQALAALISLVDTGEVSGSAAKLLFERMSETGETTTAAVLAEDLTQIDDGDTLSTAVKAVIDAQKNAVASYRSGKVGTLGFLVGQVMRETKGKANPKRVSELLRQQLD
jgi:aspartyl-tRNA(Asn)/glutamyl-tRNA(Gln) amidotransferase subunit B